MNSFPLFSLSYRLLISTSPVTAVPNAMVYSQLTGLFAGASFIVAILFYMPDSLAVVSAQLGSAARASFPPFFLL